MCCFVAGEPVSSEAETRCSSAKPLCLSVHHCPAPLYGPSGDDHPPLTWLSTICRTVASSRSEEHTSELQSLMRISYAVFCLKKKNNLLIILYNIRFLLPIHLYVLFHTL